MSNSAQPVDRHRAKAFLVGGGIAALASAAYLLRDGGFAGKNIQIFEETPLLGGSLDGAGSPSAGYTLRGGRMVTYEVYTCMFDLLSFIPSLTDATRSVKDEIYDFNERFVSNSHARLIAHGQKLDASDLGLSNADRIDLIKIMAVSEGSLGASRIVEQFQPSLFKTNFWYMWCTTFAFQPWHSAVELKRYLHRFIQELPRMHTLGGVRRTPYNQYDSIVLPLVRWLTQCGVRFTADTQVTDLLFRYGPDGKRVEIIEYLKDGATGTLQIGLEDLVFVTNGSMTAASSFGSMTAPARPMTETGGAWDLWKTLAAKHADFGRPSTFDAHVDESKWLSFTITLNDPMFFNLMEAFTGNAAGTGGAGHVHGFKLVDVRGSGAPAAFHRPARGRSGLLGIWPVRRPGWRFRKEKNVRLHGRRLACRAARASAIRRIQRADSQIGDLHSLHDAIDYKSVHAAHHRRPAAGAARWDRQFRLYRTILRNPRRCCLHGRIFGPYGADGRLFGSWAR
jgi:myosin-crossreactive antigen